MSPTPNIQESGEPSAEERSELKLPETLTQQELDELAEKVLEMMKRELQLNRERQWRQS